MYEPANNQKLKEVLPKYHCSPVLLRRNADWGGSDPSITSVSLLPLSFYRRNQILKHSLLHLTYKHTMQNTWNKCVHNFCAHLLTKSCVLCFTKNRPLGKMKFKRESKRWVLHIFLLSSWVYLNFQFHSGNNYLLVILDHACQNQPWTMKC